MRLDNSILDSNFLSFPNSLARIKEDALFQSVSLNPQGENHRETIGNLLRRLPEVEILQQASDFAVVRTCPGIHLRNAHYIVGYADDFRGLFIHNVPSGDIELSSEPLWYILQWMNRTEEGFHRVQGDLLLRDIREGWEIEQILEEEKEGMFHEEHSFVTIGNGHEIYGKATRPTSSYADAPDPDPRALTKTEEKHERVSKLQVRHREHAEVNRESKRKTYREIGLQRRGRDTGGGGGGD